MDALPWVAGSRHQLRSRAKGRAGPWDIDANMMMKGLAFDPNPDSRRLSFEFGPADYAMATPSAMIAIGPAPGPIVAKDLTDEAHECGN